LDAHGFALGAHVYLGDEVGGPGSTAGDHLLGHELVHVVQGARGELDASGISAPSDAAERAASSYEAGGSAPIGAQVAPTASSSPPAGAVMRRARSGAFDAQSVLELVHGPLPPAVASRFARILHGRPELEALRQDLSARTGEAARQGAS